ncbi:MAG: 5-(carboxyamino)imidazole ribonucleotide synthase, partial [Pseudomonadota bacterium]
MAELLPPGSTIGILGGGQLGRMLAMAAAKLGYHTHIFAPEANAPAAQVASVHTQAAYEDHAALEAFAHAVDVVTYEFENIPLETVRKLDTLVPVRPGTKALEVSQDRLAEKTFLQNLGLATAPF